MSFSVFAIIKRGILSKAIYIKIPKTNKNLIIIKFFYKKGYIFSYHKILNYFIVYLKYFNNKSVVQNIFLNNKKKHFLNISFKEIRKQYNYNKKDIILSNKYGIIDIRRSIQFKMGGNLLAILSI